MYIQNDLMLDTPKKDDESATKVLNAVKHFKTPSSSSEESKTQDFELENEKTAAIE